jgi:hypothetical protein
MVAPAGGDVGRQVPIHQNTLCQFYSVGGAVTEMHRTMAFAGIREKLCIVSILCW